MREIRLYGSEGGEAFNPLSLPLSFRTRHKTTIKKLSCPAEKLDCDGRWCQQKETPLWHSATSAVEALRTTSR